MTITWIDNWEAITYNPDLVFNVCVVAKNFEIDIKHKGFLVGLKQNVGGLVDDVNGKKLYGIALQTEKKDEYKKMTKFAENFSHQVGKKLAKKQ